MQVIVDKLLINYQRKGKGKKIILIHGWAVNLSNLDVLYKNLSKDFDVISLDLPGFGASQTPAGVWGLEEFSSFLAKFVKKLEIKDIYAVIGHSNGGAMAIKAVASGSLPVDRLVVLSSAGIRGEEKAKQVAIKLMTKAGKVISAPLPASTKNKLKHKLYTAIKSDYLVASNMKESFKKIVNQDLRLDASKIKIPTLLIYGAEDDQTPVLYGRLYHELISDSTLEIIGTAGHFVQQDKPDIVVKLIKDFLC